MKEEKPPAPPADKIEKFTSKVDNDVDFARTLQLKGMVESCLGVLLAIKQNGELNLTDNKFIRELGNKIFEDYPDEFYEINNTLLHLSNKIEI